MSVPNKKEKGHFLRNWLFYTLLFIAVGFSCFLWLSKATALRKQATACDSEKHVLLEQLKGAYHINSEKHLELMMKTFVWAVRSEMTRGNQEQVDQYFNQLVKTEKVEEITLVDTNGKVLISTNKKNEGVILSTDYTDEVLKIDGLHIINKRDQHVVAAPVLSFDSRIGTLIVLYKKEIFQLDGIKEINENN